MRLGKAQAVARAHLVLEGKLVSYTIKRSARRRAISILVDEEGLRIGAPWNAAHAAIERLLHRHSEWVLRKLDEWSVRRAPVRRWVDGEPLMLLGAPLTLRLAPLPAARPAHAQGAELHVSSAPPGPAAVARRVHEWLHTQALGCFAARVDYFRLSAGIDSKPQVRLSNARTRWGSCHVSGRIHLNWRLVQMPLRLIDYVVAHEVAHLMEMNHSKRFWRTVAGMVPDYQARRIELRQDAHRYLLV
ncbi:MAG: M48 family metallopeptidase [Burkholderiales bacterium]